MDEEVDLSQLMAFAEALSETPVLEESSWNMDDAISETTPWTNPVGVDGHKSGFADLVGTVRIGDVAPDSSWGEPDSPVARNRTSLFSQEDLTIDLEVCGETLDPRAVCIVDHPGRHAQFKNWLQAGYLSEETKRISIRDESSRAACWNHIRGQGSRASVVDGGILGGLIKSKASIEFPIPLITDLQTATSVENGDNEPESIDNTKQGRASWKDRAFVVGRTIKVAMRETGLNDSNIRDWCIWFNDLLCSLGLSDVRSMSTPGASVMEADMDFSGNEMSDRCLLELLTLFSAFKRLHVKILRLGSNMLTDASLLNLVGLTRLQHLVMDDNLLTNDGVLQFIIRNRANRRDLYEVLVAQDMLDETLIQPISMSIEMNQLRNPKEIMATLDREGITVCTLDTSGCDPTTGECKLLGKSCGIHLAGLGCQKRF